MLGEIPIAAHLFFRRPRGSVEIESYRLRAGSGDGPMKPRIGIRGQLIALVSIIVLVALAILSVPVWVYVNNFTTGVQLQSLSLTASLKAARIASEIDLLQTLCETISTRLLLQESLQNFYAHNSSQPNDVFGPARNDLLSALSGGGYAGLFQARLYSRNSTGDPHGLVNVTGNGVGEKEDNIPLPYLTPDGRRANLSADEVWGYPPMLFPNITYVSLGFPNPDYRETGAFAAMAFPHVSLPTSGGMLLGPLIINSTYALISLTIPVRSNSVPELILGYLTLVASSASIVEVQTSAEGLGSSASVLIIGPTNPWNRFDSALPASNETWTPPLNAFAGTPVQYLLPPATPAGYPDRHPHHDFASGDYDNPWPVTDYPAALDVFSSRHNVPNNATAVLSTTNEEGVSVAAGAARPQSTLVTWAVIVEQAESEALGPPRTLRKIILACVFGTLGLVLLLVVPCAHISVLPIRRLKEATERSMAPPGYEDEIGDDFDEEDPSSSGRISEKGLVAYVRRRIRRGRRATARAAMAAETRRRHFKIPARVELKKHLVTDELTELTETFNRMTEELLKQYTSLDDKVAERTRELEISKKAAEAANESKTLFIANISHELKTPLNGIMGMAAVCMEEDDIVKIKQSLKTLYKSGTSLLPLSRTLGSASHCACPAGSLQADPGRNRTGDLLLHLLEDLLSFSKNQIGQQISLEEKEFRLGDIRSQLLSIFDKQVRESGTTFSVDFVGWENAGVGQSPSPSPSPERVSIDKMLPALGPPGVGRLRDMCVWGDQHRYSFCGPFQHTTDETRTADFPEAYSRSSSI